MTAVAPGLVRQGARIVRAEIALHGAEVIALRVGLACADNDYREFAVVADSVVLQALLIAVGVDRWSALLGTPVRVLATRNAVHAIGDANDDRWLSLLDLKTTDEPKEAQR